MHSIKELKTVFVIILNIGFALTLFAEETIPVGGLEGRVVDSDTKM